MIFRFHSVQCRECGEVLQGRRDKLFCDDGCRSKHHRKTNMALPALKRIDRVLLRNRNILKDMKTAQLPTKESGEQFRWLRRKGFDFNFHTHVDALADGRLAIMCYEEGYILDEGGIQPWSAQPEKILALLPA